MTKKKTTCILHWLRRLAAVAKQDGDQFSTASVKLMSMAAVWRCFAEVGAIESQIKEAKARKKRAATAVVGDMSDMLDSLPTFDLLLDRMTIESRLRQKSVFDR